MEAFAALQYSQCKEQVARHCRFSLGRKQILELTPSYEYLWVEQEAQRAQEALDLVVRYGVLPLPGVFDITSAIADACRDKTLRPMELRHIAQQGTTIAAVHHYCKGCEIPTIHLDELFQSLGDITKVCRAIDACINVHDEIMDQASPKLASLRKSIRLCEGEMTAVAQQFIAHNQNKLTDTITASRNHRICVLVKVSEKNSIRGFVHGESASGQTAYVEPEALFHLNNQLAALLSREQEEMERILQELTQQVKAFADVLSANQKTLALLDGYFAKGEYAHLHAGCIAHVEMDGKRLFLKNARHPLIDDDHVVANTYEIKPPYRSVLITGSNTGGKTVTLKTIGLSVCLAQSGLPVVAETARLPFFDHIFADIGDEQSIQESLSTFSAHVSKLAHICEHISDRSLVLLDELGSGTDPREGECLAIAVLEELRLSQAYVLATTHYSALKSYAKQREDMMISGVEFDMENMKPTYRYLEGISGASNAFAIARRCHMKESVLQRAEQLSMANRTHQDTLLEQLEAELAAAHEKKRIMDTKLIDLKALQESLEQEKKQFDTQKEKELNALKETYADQLTERIAQAEEIIAELKAMPHEVKPHIINETAQRLRTLEDDVNPSQPEEKPTEALHIGDYVRLNNLNAYGEVIEINKDKVCVMVNGVRMNTRRSELTFTMPPQKKQVREKGYAVSKVRSHFTLEKNVIGLKVAEALPIVDQYLDQAVLARANTVRIIHGMGTGALRNGIHQYLKKNAKVESYRLGGQGEGGMGATVVTLKKAGKHHG